MDECKRIKPRGKEGPIPASFAQQRMWFLEQMDPDNAIYNQLNALIIRGQLNTRILRQCLDEVICRHEALRTNLIMDNGQVFQHISPPKALDLQIVDLSSFLPGEAMAEAERQAVIESKKPFDLGHEPLVRARLFKLSAGEHLLTFVTHHAIFDGWSVNIFISELAALYGAIRDNHPLPPEPALQYTDYAIWQRERYDRGDFDEQLRYWQDMLGGELPFLELPIAHLRPQVQSFEGAVYTRDIPRAVAGALKVIARSERATLFMVLLAAYNVLLYRHTHQKDLIVGCPIAGRHYLEIEDNIGLFVNTLPMRNRLSGYIPFIELARNVRRTALEAYEQQDIPFDKLVEKLPLDRQPSRTPVFQTLFQMRNFPGREITLSDIAIERHYFNYSTAKVDLTFEVTETKDGLSCRLVYPVALFDEQTIARMADHWLMILQSIVKDPNQPIGSLAMLTPEEKHLIVHEWNDTRADYPHEAVSRVLEERAKASPNAVAIIHDNERLTYAELNSRANRLARYMRISPGATVVIYMERSIEMVICELAILKAGGVYVPVDPSDPKPRSEFMLEDSHASLILVKKPPSGLQLPDECRMVCLETEREAIDRLEGGDLAEGPSLKDTAYIMYTSGSTGQPKGVRVPHRGICRLILNTNYVHISPGDTVAHISNPAFDASTFEVWGALLNGARLAIFDRETVLTPAMLAARISEEHVDTIFMTAQLFNLFSRETPGAFKNVRELLVGGDVVESAPVKRVLKNGPPKRLINAYGPTENTTFSIWYPVHEPVGDYIPIGKPISNTTAYILDEYYEPVPVGVTGEIYLGGDGVADGYHGRPDLDASVFIPDPFYSGSKLYRTGDLACYLPDGHIKFLGRRDSQVKIRGFRIELGEIKSAIDSFSVVSATLVTAREVNGEKRLAAYVISEGKMVDIDALRQHLRSKLPDYMIPSDFVVIDKIPLTAIGKVDYSALPEPAHELKERPSNGPQDELERALIGIWEEVLGISPVGVQDNFFDLGGHSLMAVRLIAKIEDKLKVKLPINTVFLSPTISQIASAIRGNSGTWHSLVLLRKGIVRPPIFCINNAVGGTLTEYEWILKEMKEDREAYGVQQSQHDTAYINIEDRASQFIKEVKKVQPEGPYFLLGYCAGGALAYEMARQLSNSGDRIDLLGIIDLLAPTYVYRPDMRSLKILIGRVPIIISNIAGSPPERRLERALSLPVAAVQFVKNLFWRPPDNGMKPQAAVSPYPDWIEAMPDPYRQSAMANYKAYRKYIMKPYPGSLALFLFETTVGSSDDVVYHSPSFGWEKFVGGKIKVYRIPGDHVSIVASPSVKKLTEAIEECLTQVGDIAR
jgi:aspartate racemase